MTEEESAIIDSINEAGDMVEDRNFSGNYMISLVKSSVTISKKVTYTYNNAGGETGCYIENL